MPGFVYTFTTAGFLSAGFINGQFTFDAAIRPVDFALGANYTGDYSIMIYLLPILFVVGLLRNK
jgi:hypothetical protein